MKKYFENCKTAEELKKAYRKAAAQLHPGKIQRKMFRKCKANSKRLLTD